MYKGFTIEQIDEVVVYPDCTNHYKYKATRYGTTIKADTLNRLKREIDKYMA